MYNIEFGKICEQMSPDTIKALVDFRERGGCLSALFHSASYHGFYPMLDKDGLKGREVYDWFINCHEVLGFKETLYTVYKKKLDK